MTSRERRAEAGPPTERLRRGRWVALIAVVVAAILAAAAAAFLGRGTPDLAPEPAAAPEQHAGADAPAAAPAAPTAPAESPAAPATVVRADPQSIQKAMTDCDSAAQRDPNTMYFLVIPVTRVNDAPQWTVHSWEDYGAFLLLSSNALLDGLRSGLYALDAASFRFAIVDSVTGKKQVWDATTGISTFTHKDADAFIKFRVGFDVPGKGVTYSNDYSRRPGVCYWVNVDFRW